MEGPFDPREQTRKLAMEGKSLEEVMSILAERIDTICNTKEEALRNNFRKSKLFLVQMTYQKARKVYEKEKAESTKGNMPVGGSGSPVLRRSSSAELAGTFGVDQTVAREEIEKAGGNFVDAGKALLRIALTINTEKNAETMRVQDCANCHERAATVVYIPCGHLVYCEKCHDIYKKKSSANDEMCDCPSCFNPTTGVKLVGATKTCCAICQTQVPTSHLITTTLECMHQICIPCGVEKFRRALEERYGNIVSGGLQCRIRAPKIAITSKHMVCQSKMGREKIKELQRLSQALGNILSSGGGNELTLVAKHRHRMEIVHRSSGWHCDGCRKSSRRDQLTARYRCVAGCDFDYCKTCYAAAYKKQSLASYFGDPLGEEFKERCKGFTEITDNEIEKFENFLEEEEIDAEYRGFCPECSKPNYVKNPFASKKKKASETMPPETPGSPALKRQSTSELIGPQSFEYDDTQSNEVCIILNEDFTCDFYLNDYLFLSKCTITKKDGENMIKDTNFQIEGTLNSSVPVSAYGSAVHYEGYIKFRWAIDQNMHVKVMEVENKEKDQELVGHYITEVNGVPLLADNHAQKSKFELQGEVMQTFIQASQRPYTVTFVEPDVHEALKNPDTKKITYVSKPKSEPLFESGQFDFKDVALETETGEKLEVKLNQFSGRLDVYEGLGKYLSSVKECTVNSSGKIRLVGDSGIKKKLSLKSDNETDRKVTTDALLTLFNDVETARAGIAGELLNFLKLNEPHVCTHCSKGKMCVKCKEPYHLGMTCDQFKAFAESDTGKFMLVTSKPCPKCGYRTTKYHGHGCHHIGYGIGGCTNCKHHWCYVCGGPFRN